MIHSYSIAHCMEVTPAMRLSYLRRHLSTFRDLHAAFSRKELLFARCRQMASFIDSHHSHQRAIGGLRFHSVQCETRQV